jgi:CcmD family protein
MNHTLILVMSVPMVIWLGLFAYLVLIDRALRRLESRDSDADEL